MSTVCAAQAGSSRPTGAMRRGSSGVFTASRSPESETMRAWETYGYTGPISTSWRSQNPADAATLAEAMATQVLLWETVVGERDEDFDRCV